MGTGKPGTLGGTSGDAVILVDVWNKSCIKLRLHHVKHDQSLTYVLSLRFMIGLCLKRFGWLCLVCYMRVSINGGTPKSSILVGLALKNHPAIRCYSGYPHDYGKSQYIPVALSYDHGQS